MTKTLWAGPHFSLLECEASVSALEFLQILPSAVYTRAEADVTGARLFHLEEADPWAWY